MKNKAEASARISGISGSQNEHVDRKSCTSKKTSLIISILYLVNNMNMYKF